LSPYMRQPSWKNECNRGLAGLGNFDSGQLFIIASFAGLM